MVFTEHQLAVGAAIFRWVGAFCMAAATVARTTVICSWACVRTLREPLGDTQRTHVNEQIIKLSGTHNSDLFVGNFLAKTDKELT